MLAGDGLAELVAVGDFNQDGELQASDVDILTIAIEAGDSNPVFDLNEDGEVSMIDRSVWVDDLHRTFPGDANLDGQFESADLVRVFQAGKYEDLIQDNSGWEQGDWDGDRDFTTSDLVAAFEAGGYQKGFRPLSTPVISLTVESDTGELGDNETWLPVVSLEGTADSFVIVKIADQGLSTITGFDGTFRIDGVALDVGANELSLTVRDVNGLELVESIQINRTNVGIDEISPSDGEELVSLTREVIIRFSDQVDPATVDSDSLRVIVLGEEVSGRIRVSSTERFVTFFPDSPWNASTGVRVLVDGDRIVTRIGMKLDADGDGIEGGILTADFTTLPLTRIPGTNVFGFVRDSYTGEPIVGATIRVDALPEANVVTDENGRFELTDMPAPEFFVHIDGSTAVNAPAGFVYPNVGKPFHSVPGQTAQLEMNGEPFDIFLPPMAVGDIQPLSETENTEVGFGEAGKAELLEMFPEHDSAIWELLKVDFEPGAAVDRFGNAATEATIIPVPPDRLPAPLPPNLNPQLVISIQAGAATNFDVPAPITFPNLEGLAPGEKSLISSFNHDAGRWDIIGTATVGDDGLTIESDPGVGILAPGWHFVQSGTIAEGQPCNIECLVVPPVGQEAAQLGDRVSIDLTSVVPSGAFATDWAFAPGNGGTFFTADGVRIRGTTKLAAPSITFLPEITEPSDAPGNPGRGEPVGEGTFSATLVDSDGNTVRRSGPLKIRVQDGWGQSRVSVAPLVEGISTNLEIAHVQHRLRYLGYQDRPGNSSNLLDVDGELGPRTRHALGVFNAAVLNADRVDESTNTVEPFINATNAPRWVEATVPQTGISDNENAGRHEHWMTSWARNALDAANTALSSVIQFAGASLKGGGDASPTVNHATHEAGMDMDIRIRPEVRSDIPFGPLSPDQQIVVDQMVAFANNGVTPVQRIIVGFKRYRDEANATLGRNVVVFETDCAPDPTVSSCVHDTHFHVDYAPPTASFTAEAASTTFQSASGNYSSDDPLYYHVELDNGFEISGRSDGTGHFSEVLTSNVGYVLTVYQASTNTSAVYQGHSNASGEITNIGTILLDQTDGADSDGDNLSDLGEKAIGTNPNSADTDGDGITDDAEITQGLNPLDNRGFPTGIISSLPMPGEARKIVVEENTAFVATGSHGLAVVDVSQFDNPILLGQIDLSGTATDVGVDMNLGLAAVTTETGVHIIDVSDPMMPEVTFLRDVAGISVEVADGIAYVSVGNSLIAIDLLTGDLLDTIIVGNGSITDIAQEGTFLYTMDSARGLAVVDITSGAMVARGTVVLPDGGGDLFVGNGIAYAAAPQRTGTNGAGGYATADVSDANRPKLISTASFDFADVGTAPASAIVTNGSGRGLIVGDNFGQNQLLVVDVTNTAETAQRQFTRDLPSSGGAQDVTIASGIAFVANGSAGLHVFNYLPFDANGESPSIEISAPSADLDANTPGIQVIEGTTVSIVANITDDVQVRNVELIIDGDVVRNDVSFPFDLTAIARALSDGRNSVSVQVRATDTGGNTTLSEELRFELSADVFPPEISAINLSDGDALAPGRRPIRIRFSEPMSEGNLVRDNFSLVDNEGKPIGPLDFQTRGDDRAVQLLFPALEPGAYSFSIDAPALTDRAGNALASLPINIPFTVIDLAQGITPLFPGEKFAVGNNPRSIETADFNGDGVIDLVTANLDSRNVSILLGTGNGRFAEQQQFPMDHPSSVAIGDFNGDGLSDLVTTSAIGSRVSVSLGTVDGTFTSPQHFFVDNFANSVAKGDFNNDGAIDLVVGHNGFDKISVLLGNGDGSFASPRRIIAGRWPVSVATGDFNGDGNIDIATANLDSNDISVLLGSGDGAFAAQQRYLAGTSPEFIATSDFNGDGITDLAGINRGSRDFSVLLGIGDGTFRNAKQFVVGDFTGPRSMTIGDFNGDGATDLASANYDTDDISVLLGQGDGTFAVHQRFPVGDQPASLISADFDGDGVADVAAAIFPSDVSILLGNGDGSFATQKLDVGTWPTSVTIADINGDNIPDLAAANSHTFDNTVSVLLGNGDGTFAAQQPIGMSGFGSRPVSVIVHDFNGDNIQDLATANFNSSDVSVRLGNSDGGFDPPQKLAAGVNARFLATGHFNNDNNIDLVVANFGSDDISILIGDGNGGFADQQRIGVGAGPVSVQTGDFNRDGVTDVATANSSSNDISVLLGNGGGTFAEQRFGVGTLPVSLTTGDLNGDGLSDLAVANRESSDVSVLLGRDDGILFGEQKRFASGMGPSSVTIGDFDGDGIKDLATANSDSDDVSILLGDGTGAYAEHLRFAAGDGANSIAHADFNEDGLTDLVTTNFDSGDVSVLLGQGTPIAPGVARFGDAHAKDIDHALAKLEIANFDENPGG